MSNFPTGVRLPEAIVRDEEPIIRLFLNEIYVSQGTRMSVSNFLHSRLNSALVLRESYWVVEQRLAPHRSGGNGSDFTKEKGLTMRLLWWYTFEIRSHSLTIL